MIRAYLTLLLLIVPSAVLALKAVVTVLEAPIQLKPRLNAKTVQLIRKGQRIYLHPRHATKGQMSRLIVDTKQDLDMLDEEDNDNFLSYFETIDKNGNKAYILRKYVKIIFQDEREYTQHIEPYHNDPTEYRLEEPLPDDYPFSTSETYRAGFSLTYGPNLKNNYSYTSTIDTVEASSRKGFQFFYGKKANWDKLSRFYFGGTFHFWSSKALYTLTNNATTEEQQTQVGAGPFLSYDIWRSPKYSLTSSLSLMLNLTRHQVFQETVSSDDKKMFSGLGLMPRFSNSFAIKNIAENVDFTLGIDLQVFLPHELTAGNEAEVDLASWQKDNIEMPFNAYWNIYIGIQGRY
jgi:hypothetical protein